MSIPLDRLRARLIDTRFGRKLWAYQCGQDFCGTKVHQGRVVDIYKGKKVWAEASECRWQPFDCGPVEFVLKDRWPPFGVTKCLRIRLFLADPLACFIPPSPLCADLLITFDGADKWTGHYTMDTGNLQVELQLTTTDDGLHPGYKLFQLTLKGCLYPDLVQFLQQKCAFPMTLTGPGFGLTGACCSSASPIVEAIEIHGFTERARPARLVDIQGGKKVWASSYCCPPDARCELACCECAAVPAAYAFTVAGVTDPGTPPPPPHNCTCINTTVEIPYVSGIGECQYQKIVPFCGGWVLRCINALRVWQLSFDGSLGAGGSATYQLSFDDWNCLGVNTLNFVSSSGSCLTWPTTITVTPL